MKAGSGFGMTIIVAALAAAAGHAQSPPAEQQQETVGPRELRDFSLPGTATPAQPAPQPGTPQARPDSPAQERPSAPSDRQTQTPRTQPTAPTRLETQPQPGLQEQQPEPPREEPANPSQPLEAAPAPEAEGSFFSQPAAGPIAVPPEATAPVEQSNWELLPWFLLALLGASGAAYLLYRQRSRTATAGTGNALARTNPTPPVAPLHSRLPPAAPRADKPADVKANGGGIVSTRLRPSLELVLSPVRCVVDDQQATVEFTVTALNSGNAPARDVRIEVALINAGPAQDREIGRFFEQPAGVGEPLEVIPPMRSIQLNSRVSMPLAQVRAIEAGGRRLFVPLLAFNALFRWSGGEGQTSQSYLVGREGEGAKMAPFRLDLGPRIFRNLGARPHHMQVRR
jgi:hypothetical protein